MGRPATDQSSTTTTCLLIPRVPLGSVQFWVSLLFLGCVMTQLAIYCAFGDDVIVTSSEIRDACYLSQWHNYSKVERQCLFIIMERSKRPYTFTAGKFIKLSLSSFILMSKSSFSYFTVLQQLYTNRLSD